MAQAPTPRGSETAFPCDQHSGVVARLDEHRRRLDSGNTRMEVIERTVTDIRDRLLGRPSWIVLVIISFFSSMSLGSAALWIGSVKALHAVQSIVDKAGIIKP